MFGRAIPEEVHSCPNHEVAFDLLREEVKLVGGTPNVCARSLQRIRLVDSVVVGATCQLWIPNVRGVVENSGRLYLADREQRQEAYGKQK